MASLGRLLCVLGLFLCGAASFRLSAPRAGTSEKPIIGKQAGRGGAGAAASASCLGEAQVHDCEVRLPLQHKSQAKTPSRSC